MNENKEITLDSLMQAKHIELSSGPQTQEETALMINQLEAETEQLSPDKREK